MFSITKYTHICLFVLTGKVYTVINKLHGKVLDAVGMDEKEKFFLVQAEIPVIESEGFANEIRKTTSGQANPSLRFSHYEVRIYLFCARPSKIHLYFSL